MTNRWKWGVETVTNFVFLSSKITVDSDCSHEIKKICCLEEMKVARSVMFDISVIICNSNCNNYTVHGISQLRILEWIAISFSKGSSQPRDWTWIGRQILYHWATREALFVCIGLFIFRFLGSLFIFVFVGFCLATPCSRQDLSFPTRDGTCAPCSGRVAS